MTDKTETAILAGGCFWGMQDLIRKLPGVLSTRVGYTGGDVCRQYRIMRNFVCCFVAEYVVEVCNFLCQIRRVLH